MISGLDRDAGEELLAVFGGTAGFGRDQSHAADFTPGELGGADAQGLDGTIHGVLRQTTGGRQPLTQADDARKGIDDAKLAGPGRLGDQQAAIVGTEIERRVEIVMRTFRGG